MAKAKKDKKKKVTVRTKKRCCRSGTRCKTCPVVWKRLETAGMAVRLDVREYRPKKRLTKNDIRAARKRGG